MRGDVSIFVPMTDATILSDTLTVKGTYTNCEKRVEEGSIGAALPITRLVSFRLSAVWLTLPAYVL